MRAARLKKSGGVLLSQGPSDQPPEEVSDDNAPDTARRLLQSDQATQTQGRHDFRGGPLHGPATGQPSKTDPSQPHYPAYAVLIRR